MSDITSAQPGDKIPDIQVINFPTDQIDASPYQARKRFAPEGIQEMANSIREKGIIQPLIVRVADESTGRLELVAGERRWRGACQLGLQVVPVIVRELSPLDAEEIMLIENLQREDLSQSEEAHGYDRMLSLRHDGQPLYTVESLAAKLGKSLAHVTARLKLLLCPKDLIDAVDRADVAVTTAMLVGRIPDEKARAACAREVLTPDLQQVPLNYVQTKELIRARYVVQLDKRDFDLADPLLVPVEKDEAGQRCAGGACTDCPFRSGNIDGVEVRQAASETGKAGGATRGANPNMCTLPKCHKAKLDAAWRETKAQALKAGKKVLDGDAAIEAFSGHNGDLAYDADYVSPDSQVSKMVLGVYVTETWKEAVKGQDVPAVLARRPDTRQVMPLYARKDAEAAMEANVKAKLAAPEQQLPEAGKIVSGVTFGGAGISVTLGSDEVAAKAAADKAAKAKEKAAEEINRITVSEAVREIIDSITGKGPSLELYDLVFQMALTHSGADGMHFLGHFFKIEMPKGADRGMHEEEIIKLVRSRAETPNAWLAHIVAALIARQVKWNGVGSDDMEACLKHAGFKLPELKRRAEALYKAEQKAKKPKAEKKAASDSSEPVDWSADKEADKTAAADARAADDMAGFFAKGPSSTVSQAASGPSATEIANGVQDSKLGKPGSFTEGDIAAAAQCMAAGTTDTKTLLGPKPKPADKPAYNAWSRVRMQLRRAVARLGGDQTESE